MGNNKSPLKSLLNRIERSTIIMINHGRYAKTALVIEKVFLPKVAGYMESAADHLSRLYLQRLEAWLMHLMLRCKEQPEKADSRSIFANLIELAFPSYQTARIPLDVDFALTQVLERTGDLRGFLMKPPDN